MPQYEQRSNYSLVSKECVNDNSTGEYERTCVYARVHVRKFINKCRPVGEIFDKCPIAENRFTSCLWVII